MNNEMYIAGKICIHLILVNCFHRDQHIVNIRLTFILQF